MMMPHALSSWRLKARHRRLFTVAVVGLLLPWGALRAWGQSPEAAMAGECLVKVRSPAGRAALKTAATAAAAPLEDVFAAIGASEVIPLFQAANAAPSSAAWRSQAALADSGVVYRVRFQAPLSIDQACAQLRSHPAIAYCQPNSLVHASLIPNDPYYRSAGSWPGSTSSPAGNVLS